MTVGRRSTSRNAAQRLGFAGSLAVAVGIGAAIAVGCGVAHAEGPAEGPADRGANAPSDGSPSGESPARLSGAPHSDRKTVADSPESAPGLPGRRSQILSTTPGQDREPATRGLVEPRRATRLLDAPLRAARAGVETKRAVDEPAVTKSAQADVPGSGVDKSVAATEPSPEDETPTAYGDIGKWMLKDDNQIANWGGKPYDGKTLLEPVNVIIVDPTSTSASQAARRLNRAMFLSGFPARPLHTSGFNGSIDDVTYGQKPQPVLLGYSNNFFLFRNDHGRIFGPDPVQNATGYVWSGAFSTEEVAFSGGAPGHVYVSSDDARDALASQLVASGQATYAGTVPLENAYNTDTVTTGDHDGYAVVLVLTGNAVLPRREFVTRAQAAQ